MSDEILGKPLPFMVRDYFSSWPSFTSTLYCALDYQIVIFFIMAYNLFQRATGSSIISVAIIYCLEKVFKYLRHDLGERNIAAKTLIDERFLI